MTKEQKRAYEKAYRLANLDAHTSRVLKRIYGITLDEYNNLLTSQDNGCMICEVKHVEGEKSFPVDRCHTTLKVRGILCQSCNRGIGLMKDNPTLLRSAADYIERTYG